MPQKIIFFTVGPVPTEAEADEIAAFSDALAGYTLKVMNGAASPNYGENPETCDFVAGTVPPDFEEVPPITVEEIGAAEPLPPTQAVVADGQIVPVSGAGSIATIAVAAGVASVVLSGAAGTQSLLVGLEDTVTRLDINSDGKPDVYIVTDNPPQNP